MEYTMNAAYGKWSETADRDMYWLCLHGDCGTRFNSFDEDNIKAHVRQVHAIRRSPITPPGCPATDPESDYSDSEARFTSTTPTQDGTPPSTSPVVSPISLLREERWQKITLPAPGGEKHARRLIPRGSSIERGARNNQTGLAFAQPVSVDRSTALDATARILAWNHSADGTETPADQWLCHTGQRQQLPYIFDNWHGCRFFDEDGKSRWRCFCCGEQHACVVRDVRRHLRDIHGIETTTVYNEDAHGNNAWQGA